MKSTKGITLIALIITIIILLILTGVTMNIAVNGGLFNNAQRAVDDTNAKVSSTQDRVDDLMDEWDTIESGIKGETSEPDSESQPESNIPPDLTSSNTTFTQDPTGWTNESVKVIASTTISGYTLQTSQDGTSWSSTNIQTFTSNGTMYARLVNSSGTAGEYTTYDVTNIDITAPTRVAKGMMTISRDNTQNTVRLQLNAIKETQSGIGNVIFYYKAESDTSYSKTTYTTLQGQTSSTGLYITLVATSESFAGQTIYAYAEIYDLAGNMSQSALATISATGSSTSYGD